jgi:hypothetical protein
LLTDFREILLRAPELTQPHQGVQPQRADPHQWPVRRVKLRRQPLCLIMPATPDQPCPEREHAGCPGHRVRQAEESLGRLVGDDRGNVELALRAGHWLGSSVLRPAT